MKNIVDWKKEFYDELNSDNINDNLNDNICLITKSELTLDSIKLPCNHSFNYLPLYNEICNQKNSKKRNLETQVLSLNQIKCPYCRTKFNNLLPYIDMPDVAKVRGVNSPLKYSMFLSKCKYIIKSGKNKGQLCNKDCNFNYCSRHKTIVEKKKGGCNHILLKGKNKGNMCMRTIKENGLCSIHCK